MSELLGRAFGLYALYRALAGRPLKGKRRPPWGQVIVTIKVDVSEAIRAITRAEIELARVKRTAAVMTNAATAPMITANTITASTITANAITQEKLRG